MNAHRSPVLIVGAGPVGLLLACELARRDVAVTVLERRRTIDPAPRAGTLHARTVQQLKRRGYLRSPGSAFPGSVVRARFHFGGHPLITLSTPPDDGPPLLNEPQQALEQRLEEIALDHGAAVERGWTVTGVEQDAAGVRAHATTADRDGGDGRDAREADWEGAYLVACDGARSTVRGQAGIRQETTPATFSGLVALARFDPHALPPGWSHGPGGATLFNPAPGGHGRAVTHDFTVPLPDRSTAPTGDELAAALKRIHGRTVPVSDVVHVARFSDHTRVAETYRSGRVLVAGDAAHSHAPLGGQGLNTGLQDAVDLAWKLSAVVGGRVPEALLDTYTDDRRAAAARVAANTRAQAALMDPAPNPLKDYFFSLLEDPATADAVAAEVSGQAQALPRRGGDHPLAGTFLPDRPLEPAAEGPVTLSALLADGRALLVTEEGADAGAPGPASAQNGLYRVVAVPGPLPWPCRAVLCRPDGYAAWATDGPLRLEEMHQALPEWLGPRSSGREPQAAPGSAP